MRRADFVHQLIVRAPWARGASPALVALGPGDRIPPGALEDLRSAWAVFK